MAVKLERGIEHKVEQALAQLEAASGYRTNSVNPS
jgi:hypothetical protein